MAIEVLFNLIRQRHSPADGKVIATSLQQDPLVWQALQDHKGNFPYLEAGEASLEAYSPGMLAAAILSQQNEIQLLDLQNSDTVLPTEIKQAAAKAFESTFNSGLPPADLPTAGLLALALRERHKIKGSWQGISEEILIKRGSAAVEKNVQIWQTPAACLYSVTDDFSGFISDFLDSKSSRTAMTGVALLVHAILANPLPNPAKLDSLFSSISGISVDLQLDALKYLEASNETLIAKSLATNLMQVRSNIDFIARTYSELETFATSTGNDDPLRKSVRFGLAENLNRLAAFHHFSGDEMKSAEIYRKASEILDFIKAQTLFQSVVVENSPVDKSTWLEIIKALPASRQARLQYINGLIKQDEQDEAERMLTDISDCPEKTYLLSKLRKANSAKSNSFVFNIDNQVISEGRTSPLSSSYFVHQPELRLGKDFLKDLLKSGNGTISKLNVNAEYSDPEQIELVRDWFIKSQQYEKAIELTSYLGLVQPESTAHQKSLAKLYGLAKHWTFAYDSIQEIVKSETSPLLDDLILFAESALHTDRTDMSISICQNILKQSPNNTKALVLLGQGFWQKGDSVKAIQHMEEVVETIPEEAETWLALSKIWRENGQSEKAMEVLQKGVVAIPDSPSLLWELGKTLLEKQSPADAITYLKKAHEIDNQNAEGQFNLASASYQLGQYEQAWSLLEPHLANYEQEPAIAKLLGHVLLAIGKTQQAKPILLTAANHFPEDRGTVLALAKIIITETDQTINDDVNLSELTMLRSILEKSLDHYDADSQLQLNLADVDRLMGNYRQAFDAYLQIAEQERPGKAKPTWQLQYGLGKTALAMGKTEMALAALQDASSQQPENISILHALANAFQVSDLTSKSSDIAKTALKLAPQDLGNILWFVKFNLDHNQPEDAIKALNEALVLIPNEPVLDLWLSRAQLSAGEIQSAETNLWKVVNHSAVAEQELHQVAYLGIQVNNLDLTIAALEKSSQSSNTFCPLNVLELAAAYASRDQNQKALEALDQDEMTLRQYPELAIFKADILEKIGQYTPAFELLLSIQSAIETDPVEEPVSNKDYGKSPLLYTMDFTQAGYLYRLGQFNRFFNENEKALTMFEKALSVKPEMTEYLLVCAETYALNLDFPQAENKLIRLDKVQKNQVSQDLACLKVELAYFTQDSSLATEMTEQLLPGHPASPRSMALQSRLAVKMGDYEVARNYLDDAVKIYDETFTRQEVNTIESKFHRFLCLIGMAEASLYLDDPAFAADLYEKAETLVPGQPLVQWRYPLSLCKAAEAQSKAEVLSITSHSPGKKYLSQDAFTQFTDKLDAARTKLDQDTWLCLKARGTAAFEGEWLVSTNLGTCLKDPSMAASIVMNSDDDDIIRQVLEVYPDDPQVLQAYGLNALRYKKVDAVPAVENALRSDPLDPCNHALLAFLNKSDPESALNSIETALQFWPDEPGWHAYAAELELAIGLPESASKHISTALESEPENADFWLQSAEIRLQSNDLVLAKADLEKSVSFQAKDVNTWSILADVNRRMGDMPAAIRNVQNAQQLDPQNKSLAVKEAQLLLDQQEFESAIEKTEHILEQDQANADALIIQAQAYAKSGKFEPAINIMKSALQSNPTNTRLALETLKIRKEFEGTEAALPELITLAESNTEDPDVLTLLTDWLIQTNRLEKAAQTAQTILRIIPKEAKVHLMLGRLQRKNGQLDQAIAHLSDAITYDPTLVEAYIELGKTYQDRRDLEEAIKIFQKGTEVDASDPRPYYFAGMALKECKDYTGAEMMLKQAKHNAPEDAEIIRQLGVITAMNLINNLREMS